MLLVANLASTRYAKNLKNDWNLGKLVLMGTHQRELSYEYQYDRVNPSIAEATFVHKAYPVHAGVPPKIVFLVFNTFDIMGGGGRPIC